MATYKSIRYIVPTEAVEHTDSINALNDVDTNTTAPTDGQILKWNNTNSKWYPGDVEESASTTQKAIFGFGFEESVTVASVNTTNLVSSTGVVSTDTTGVGTARSKLAASGYGGDKGIFGFGSSLTNKTNLVSNAGVVSTDSTGIGTGRGNLAAAGFGGDKAIFGFGDTSSSTFKNITNLVSNTGVVSSDQTGVGTARSKLAATGYGGDKAIFGFGRTGSNFTNITNLVSNAGVVASDTTGVGSGRGYLAAAGYGSTGQAIFGFGEEFYGMDGPSWFNETNLVSNTGVVASDTTGVGSDTAMLAAAGYGGDKAIFGFGSMINPAYGSESITNKTNLVSNTGVVSSDVTGVGIARYMLAAAGYSTTA